MLALVRKEKWYILIFICVSFLLFYVSRNYVDSADLIQYLTQAKRYQYLSLSEAANDYWSPMLSWLIIPFDFFIQDYLLSFKFLQFLLSLPAFVIGMWLCDQLKLSYFLSRILMLNLALMVLGYGLFNGSPDLLYLDILLFTLFLFQRKQRVDKVSAIFIGISGAALFLSKSFGLVFFLGMIFCILFFFRRKIAFVRNSIFLLFLSFFLLSLPWIYIVSHKAHRIIISGAAEYNFNIMNPEMNPDIYSEIKHPISFPHLKAPSEKFGISAWLYPPSFNLKSWFPVDNALHYFCVVGRNITSLAYYYSSFLLFVFFSLLLLSVKDSVSKNVFSTNIKGIFFHWKKFFSSFRFFIVSAIISTALYSLILTQPRYLWLNELLFLLLLFYLLKELKFIFQWILGLGLLVITGFVFIRNLTDCTSSLTNVDWKKNEFTFALKNQGSTFSCVSDYEMGPDGYTLNSAICLANGGLNYGVQRLEEMSELTPVDFYFSSGNRTINVDRYPFVKFVVYSPSLNASLYRIQH